MGREKDICPSHQFIKLGPAKKTSNNKKQPVRESVTVHFDVLELEPVVFG